MKTHEIYFYSLIDIDGNFEEYQGEPVVNVGFSTNPRKHLRNIQHTEKKTVFVMLIKGGKLSDFKATLREIEELRTYKSWYLLEPLAALIRRKCKETGFVPYKMKNETKVKKVQEESRSNLSSFF